MPFSFPFCVFGAVWERKRLFHSRFAFWGLRWGSVPLARGVHLDEDLALAEICEGGVLDGIVARIVLEDEDGVSKVSSEGDPDQAFAVIVRNAEREHAVIPVDRAAADADAFDGGAGRVGYDGEGHRGEFSFLEIRGFGHAVACLEDEQGSCQ